VRLICQSGVWTTPGISGLYAFFNAANCPAGWIAANGSNGTVDLRGEFIRGWDSGRGADPGRGLAAWQDGTWTRQIMNDFTDSDIFGNPDYVGQAYSSADATSGWPTSSTNFNGSGSFMPGYMNDNWSGGPHYNSGVSANWIRYRPRNMALLACMKL